MKSVKCASLASATSNYEKYQTSNPLMRWIIRRFLIRLRDIVERIHPTKIVDLGCGEGLVASTLAEMPFTFKYLGLDINQSSLKAAQRLLPEMNFQEADILRLKPQSGWADLALCIEVVEHIEDPRTALSRITEWTSDTAVISVPWEPYFRIGNFLRGKYLATWGNHPEHIQQFNPISLDILVKEFFREVTVETCFPWLLAIARLPKD